MIISKQIPPIYNKIKKVFKVNWNQGIAIAYGDTVYSKYDLPEDLKIHEQVHLDSQELYGVEEWWKMYLNNIAFRLRQEIDAHKAQVQYLKFKEVDIKYRNWKLEQIPKDLSGPMYGNILTLQEAKDILEL